MTTIPPLRERPKRPVFKNTAPSIASLKAANDPKPTGLPPTPKPASSGLPERPKRPSRLTEKKTVKHNDGTVTEEEKDVWIVQQDSRIIDHLAEHGVATRKILAYLTGADDMTVDRKMDSLRKRLGSLIHAGVLETVGNEQGANARYSLTSLGREYYSGSYLSAESVPSLDEGELLNLSSVISRISSPRSSSFFASVAAGAKSVGLPVISRSRISSDTEQMMNVGRDITNQQMRDVGHWLEQDYPVVGLDWSMDEMSAEQSNDISKFFHRGFQSDERLTVPCYLFQIFNEHGIPQNIIDFAIPLPHIVDYDGETYMSAMACFVDIDQKSDGFYRNRFAVIANSPVPYTKVTCFVPDSRVGTWKALRDNWDYMCDNGFINPARRDDLIIMPYTPINAPSTRTNFAKPDRPVPVKHFGRG